MFKVTLCLDPPDDYCQRQIQDVPNRRHKAKECDNRVGEVVEGSLPLYYGVAIFSKSMFFNGILRHVNYIIALLCYFNQSVRFGIMGNAQLIGLQIGHGGKYRVTLTPYS